MPVSFDEEGNGIEFEFQDVDDYRPSFTYYGQNQDTKQWELIVSHGGKIFENLVQAIARDVLSEGMLRVDSAGMEISGHVHDEIIALTEDDPFALGAMEMEKLMSGPMPWAPTIPLGAEAWEGYFYRK
jgi:DNA polymerase